jgi:hypothetical protein
VLEGYFRDFLRHQVEHSTGSVTVTYTPALRHGGRTATFTSPGAQLEPSTASNLEIKVLTPAFYSRFVHYTDLKEAFAAEALSPRDENHTVYLSDPSKTTQLLDQVIEGTKVVAGSTESPPLPTDSQRWSLLRIIRHEPSAQSYPSETPLIKRTAYLPHHYRAFAPLDHFVSSTGSAAYAQKYRRTLISLFISEYIAFGSPSILHAYGVILQAFLTFYLFSLLPDFAVAGLLPSGADLITRVLLSCGLSFVIDFWEPLKAGL